MAGAAYCFAKSLPKENRAHMKVPKGMANPWGLVYDGAIEKNEPGKVNLIPTTYIVNGIEIAANLYVPADYDEADAKTYPAVAVAHPNGGVKEQVAGLFAQKLAEADSRRAPQKATCVATIVAAAFSGCTSAKKASSHGGMILLITDGVGYYQEEGKPAQILRKGDIFEIPEGVRHWHGASKDSWFSQIVIYDSHWNGAHGDGKIEFVSDEEYEQLAEEEYEGRVEPKFGSQMFSRAEKGAKLPTFTGTAFVNDLTGAENAAKCPPLHYVVFEPGVINNWHIHEGGQILLATDGIGYHQIEGEAVQILRPGDVAICPPGIKHWHGGSSNSTFAHIATNLDPSRRGVTWLEAVSQEAYKAIEAEAGITK